MAIVKFNNRKNSTSNRRINKLKRIIDYITDPHKTCNDLIGGIGVNKANALERMNTVKEYYNKSGGREYIHFCVSFKGKQDADIVYDIGERIALFYKEYQVLFSVHLNTYNTHIHFIINTVCVNDGHKFTQSKSNLQELKNYIDTVIQSFGLSSESISVDTDYYQDYYFDDEFDEQENEQLLIEPMIFFDNRVVMDNNKYNENITSNILDCIKNNFVQHNEDTVFTSNAYSKFVAENGDISLKEFSEHVYRFTNELYGDTKSRKCLEGSQTPLKFAKELSWKKDIQRDADSQLDKE